MDEKDDADGCGSTSKKEDDVEGKAECPSTPDLDFDPAVAAEFRPPGLSSPICIQRSLMGWGLVDCADKDIGRDGVADSAACFFELCRGSWSRNTSRTFSTICPFRISIFSSAKGSGTAGAGETAPPEANSTPSDFLRFARDDCDGDALDSEPASGYW